MDLETLLFSVGIFIFMVTVYGTVMAGGAVLKRKQVDELGDDVEFVTDESGTEYLVSTQPDEPGRDR